MVRHRGIGMNKPVKKKVEQPGLLSVRLLLQGHVRAAPPALEEAAVEAAVEASTLGLDARPRRLDAMLDATEHCINLDASSTPRH